MKIHGNSRCTVPWPAAARGASTVEAAPARRDGISLEGMAQAKELLRRVPGLDEDAVDLERVAAVAAQMRDGVFQASVEEVADAILDDLSTVMAWLSDGTASQE